MEPCQHTVTVLRAFVTGPTLPGIHGREASNITIESSTGPQVISIGKVNNKLFVVEMSSVRERWLTGQAPWFTLAETKEKNLVTLPPNAFREIF